MIVQNQFPLGGEPKPENKSGLILFFGALALFAAAGAARFYYNYTLLVGGLTPKKQRKNGNKNI